MWAYTKRLAWNTHPSLQGFFQRKKRQQKLEEKSVSSPLFPRLCSSMQLWGSHRIGVISWFIHSFICRGLCGRGAERAVHSATLIILSVDMSETISRDRQHFKADSLKCSPPHDTTAHDGFSFTIVGQMENRSCRRGGALGGLRVWSPGQLPEENPIRL